MKGFFVAIQFLTRIPLPAMQVEPDAFARSMRWFPAVGLLIGALLAGAATLAGGQDSWVAALLVLTVWVAITGALHLDGLSDLADAIGAGHKDSTRFRAVLADPHIGSFGVVIIVLQLLAKLVLLHALLEQHHVLPLLAIPFAARLGPLVWTRWLPQLHTGLSAHFVHAIRLRHILIWLVPLAVGIWFMPRLAAAPLFIILWAIWLKRRVGGVSGDCHGAGIELVETGLLVSLLL